MGLGSWVGRDDWPVKWLLPASKMKFFGFILHPTYKAILQSNWEDQFKKFSDTLFSWESRILDSVFERAEVLKTFALSRVWYRAQVLPLPLQWARKFEKAISTFLWKGCQLRNLLPMETFCLPLESGGLAIPYLRAKCDTCS